MVNEIMGPYITSHLINRNCTFINQMYPPLAFIVHRTAGHVNVQQLYDYWQSTCVSSHFGISYDGYGYDPYDIWQFVNLWDGAGANCCPENGHHSFFNRGGNANTYTISVEVCTPNTGNNGLMTNKQVESLVYLIQYVTSELGISTDNYSEYWNGYETAHTWLAGNGGIGMHRDVSPPNKGMCPGDPYYHGQMDSIIEMVRGGTSSKGKYMDFDDNNGMIIRMWESFYQRLQQTTGSNIPIPRRDTGIFNQWRKMILEQNKFLGGVMSEEWPYENCMIQDFTSGQFKYNKDDGSIDWIDAT
jgi:hypothetical protein